MKNTFQEISSLRKAGKVDDAYRLAEEALKETPEDLWTKRAMGWVLYEYLDQSATNRDFSKYLHWLQEMVALHLDNEESMLMDSVMWSLRKLLADTDAKSAEYDQLLSSLQQLPRPQKGKAYSSVLSAALRLGGKWLHLSSFIDWWGLDNLSGEDYDEVTLSNGSKMMSLAERTIICYSKILLREGEEDSITRFVSYIRSVIEQHKEYVYPPYYLAKLLLKKGEGQAAYDLLKQFARLKSREFWVWQLLADTQSDSDLKMSFLCKALTCGGKEEMLVSLREESALLFANMGHLSEAKHETLRAIEARKRKGWSLTNGLRNIQVEKWFMQTTATRNNEPFYRRFSDKAERLILGELSRFTCLVTYVNEEKRMVSFVSEDKIQGFFKMDKKFPEIKKDSLVTFQTNALGEDRPTLVRNVEVEVDRVHPSFYKQFEGKYLNKGAFGVVEDVFVESRFLSGITHGNIVKGVACISFDRKKKRWGWRALSIEVVR